MRSSPAVLVGAAVLGLTLSGPAVARGELVILATGEVLKVADFEVRADKVRLDLPSGGRLTLPLLRVDRIVDDEIAAPEGDSPFHQIDLVPGTYTITVENPATGARESVTATIPSDTAGAVKLSGPDYKQGIRQLLSRDPYFEDNP